ncbi:quinone oxidoreductase isoform X1 [Thrips palmi]|uniref:Quinone oxidoreductase isoform X1 n=2 Tax=Thrips palmi TaxID=161013 RepID=A0A6P9A179_THRPL|nr:quinone oxidoreductase isoform X1 [Thrips palmi]
MPVEIDAPAPYNLHKHRFSEPAVSPRKPPIMNKLCRQVSIESPGPTIKDCVFSFEVPVPDVPPNGARIRVVCAGACYRIRRSPSISSVSSTGSVSSLSTELSQDLGLGGSVISGLPGGACLGGMPQSPAHHGVRDGALFPGYEVAGIVESLGAEVEDNATIQEGDRVVLYPYDGVPHGYAEFIIVHELKYLVKIPDSVPLPVAAMLPTGALLAMNTVFNAHQYVEDILRQRGEDGVCKILIVGTGGLALWAMRIASHHFKDTKMRVQLTVASLKDEGFLMAKEFKTVNVVQWSEDLYERQLIERTTDACNGEVDIVIDFGTTSRSLHRSLQCLSKGGVVFMCSEVAEKLMPKFSRLADERQQRIKAVDMGTIEQLQELVKLVGNGEIEPPPHTVFPAEEACKVMEKLCNSEIQGRAILQFYDAD